MNPSRALGHHWKLGPLETHRRATLGHDFGTLGPAIAVVLGVEGPPTVGLLSSPQMLLATIYYWPLWVMSWNYQCWFQQGMDP